MSEAAESFAREEESHILRLQAVREKRFSLSSLKQPKDMKIADYVVEAGTNPNMDYPELLIVAMKAEKAAFKLYMDLAEFSPDPEARSLFISLAQEEARHKLKFEIEYDDFVMQEN